MKNDNYLIYLFILFIYITPLKSGNNYDIKHLEPPFWWTNMSNATLQLMVHGDDISDLKPQISYPGLSITAIHQVTNLNYLFIDILIDNNTVAGDFIIGFIKNDQIVLNHKYSLLELSLIHI